MRLDRAPDRDPKHAGRGLGLLWFYGFDLCSRMSTTERKSCRFGNLGGWETAQSTQRCHTQPTKRSAMRLCWEPLCSVGFQGFCSAQQYSVSFAVSDGSCTRQILTSFLAMSNGLGQQPKLTIPTKVPIRKSCCAHAIRNSEPDAGCRRLRCYLRPFRCRSKSVLRGTSSGPIDSGRGEWNL